MASLLTFPTHETAGWARFRERWSGRHKIRGFESLRLDGKVSKAALARFNGGVAVTDKRIWLNGLPDAFRGFRILQLSDIHHSLFVPLDRVAAVVELSNLLKPDLVALTGDFVTYSRTSIGPVAEVLGALRAPAGVFAVLGNHDFRVGAKAIERALRHQHIDVLRNRHVELREGGDRLYVAGVDDYGYGADLEGALRGVPSAAPSVLLGHNPRLVQAAACRGAGLMLSGHTHGGQVNLPLLGSVYGRTPEQLRFKIGWDRLGDTQIYVSRGIGTIVLPWRLRCPAEIPCLTLETYGDHGNQLGNMRYRGFTSTPLKPDQANALVD
jgi:predicted MPP superfamily phosphohydrolase